jgi:hypothetical protein
MKPSASAMATAAWLRFRQFSQLLWPDKNREVWFSLGENHEKANRFGLHQLRNCPELFRYQFLGLLARSSGACRGGSVSGTHRGTLASKQRRGLAVSIVLSTISLPQALAGLRRSTTRLIWVRERIFANGVDQETELDAAIPLKTGVPVARGLCVSGVVKNGRT